MDNTVCVKTYNTRLEADLDRSYLQSLGIESIVTADDLGGAYPFPFQPNSAGVSLLVKKSDFEKAKESLEKVSKK